MRLALWIRALCLAAFVLSWWPLPAPAAPYDVVPPCHETPVKKVEYVCKACAVMCCIVQPAPLPDARAPLLAMPVFGFAPAPALHAYIHAPPTAPPRSPAQA